MVNFAVFRVADFRNEKSSTMTGFE